MAGSPPPYYRLVKKYFFEFFFRFGLHRANIFSLSKFCSKINLKIFTETGCFICINKDTEFKSFKGQQVSLFTLNDKTKITTKGLKYNFNKNAISTIFYGTLNESVCEKFHVKINNECAIIFLCFS